MKSDLPSRHGFSWFFMGFSNWLSVGPTFVTFDQESLLHHDVLPRLIDSVLCPEGPEMHFIRTWKERPTDDAGGLMWISGAFETFKWVKNEWNMLGWPVILGFFFGKRLERWIVKYWMCFFGPTTPRIKRYQLWCLGMIQLIGLREKLQEHPIFHRKIYGFL